MSMYSVTTVSSEEGINAATGTQLKQTNNAADAVSVSTSQLPQKFEETTVQPSMPSINNEAIDL